MKGTMSLSKEIDNWMGSLDLNSIEILYIYGLGLGFYFEPLKGWLEEKKERQVVFIEDDLAVISTFMQASLSQLLPHPRLHLHFIPHAKKWRSSLKHLAQAFPSDRIAFTTLHTNEKASKRKIAEMRLFMHKETARLNTLYSEILNSHRLFSNIYSNFKRLSESFLINHFKGRFANIPAIVCGAGPSLTSATPILKQCEDRALIFAGGSTIPALGAEQVQPHLCVAIDPNPLEYERLKEAQAFQTPFIFIARLFPSLFSLLNGPFGYMRSSMAVAIEKSLGTQLNLGEELIGSRLNSEAFSVTTLTIALAHYMGCNPIILSGVDLAFTNKKCYAEGVGHSVSFDPLQKKSRAIDQWIKKKDREGKPLYTRVGWMMEASAIDAYVRAHPETLFINSTEGGLGFSNIAYIPLDKAIEKHGTHFYDLQALLQTEIEDARLDSSLSSQIEKWFEELRQSLERMGLILEEMEKHPNSGKRVVLEMDLQEEFAFSHLFQAVDKVLERLTQNSPEAALPEKLHHYKAMLKSYLETLRASTK